MSPRGLGNHHIRLDLRGHRGGSTVLEALSRCGGPAGLRKAGRSKLAEIVKGRAPRMGAQTVVVPGTAAAETILPRLADTLRDLLKQRDQVAVRRSRGRLMRARRGGMVSSTPSMVPLLTRPL